MPKTSLHDTLADLSVVVAAVLTVVLLYYVNYLLTTIAVISLTLWQIIQLPFNQKPLLAFFGGCVLTAFSAYKSPELPIHVVAACFTWFSCFYIKPVDPITEFLRLKKEMEPIKLKFVSNPAHDDPKLYALAYGFDEEHAAVIAEKYTVFEGHYNCENITQIYLEGRLPQVRSDSVTETLKQLGFKESRRGVDIEDLVKDYGYEYLFQLYAMLVPLWIYTINPESLPANKWTDAEYECEGRKKVVSTYRQTKWSENGFRKKEDEEDSDDEDEKEDIQQSAMKGCKYYYHGTSLEKAECVVNGINIYYARPNLDFNWKPEAFYLNPSFNGAREWCKFLHEKDPELKWFAVIRYRVSRKKLKELDPSFVFDTANDKWKTFVTDCRNRKLTPAERREKFREWDKKHWIYGPIAYRFNDEWVPNGAYQLALKSDEAAMLFDAHLDGVVILKCAEEKPEQEEKKANTLSITNRI